MLNLMTIPFDCDRTCPAHESLHDGKFWCRFRPLLDLLGPTRVHSHTATMQVEYDDLGVFRKAVEACDGLWLGQGTYDLHDTIQTGYGFRLPMSNGLTKIAGKAYWYHPLVLRSDKKIAYDEFGGAWSDIAGLARLKSEYAFQLAKQEAENLGWATEKLPNGSLLVYHPSGGTLTIAEGGKLETAGFTGNECHKARKQLGLDVDESSIVATAEACSAEATIQLSEGG